MKKRDYILIGCIVLLAVVSGCFFRWAGKDAQQAVVTVDGEVYGTYPLTEDQQIMIKGGNRLEIQDGHAKMEWADCRGSALCTSEGNLSNRGEHHLSSEPGGGQCERRSGK